MYPTRKRVAATIGCAVLAVAAAAVLAVGAANAESNGGVRVMPLGDSITDGFTVSGGYRIGLWQRLVAAGNVVDFVGSLSNGPSNLGDHDHEGHTGWRIDQIDPNIVGWLQTTTPHTVLLHLGTNDIIQNIDLPNAPARLSTLIDHITATVPAAEVFVATIIPLGTAAQEANVRTFNAAIPGIVQAKVNAGRHVHLVDMHAALTTADLADGIHPNAGGYDKMAAVWFTALRSVPGSIGGVPTTSPTTPRPSPTVSPTVSPRPSPTVSPTAVPTGGTRSCSATYSVVGQWQDGFQAAVTVTAGAAPLSSWTVSWTFANGQSVTSFWNTTVTASGSSVTATNVSYNGTVAAGASTQFGFLAHLQGANAVPTLACAGR